MGLSTVMSFLPDFGGFAPHPSPLTRKDGRRGRSCALLVHLPPAGEKVAGRPDEGLRHIPPLAVRGPFATPLPISVAAPAPAPCPPLGGRCWRRRRWMRRPCLAACSRVVMIRSAVRIGAVDDVGGANGFQFLGPHGFLIAQVHAAPIHHRDESGV